MRGHLQREDPTVPIFHWKLLVGGQLVVPLRFTVDKNGFYSIQWERVAGMTSWEIQTMWEPGS